MKRRFLLIGFCVATPLLLAWWAMAAASWRPVILRGVANPEEQVDLSASTNYVLATIWSSSGYLLDVNTGRFQEKNLPMKGEMGLSGNRFWSLRPGKTPRNWIIEIAGQSHSLSFSTEDQYIESFILRISSEHNRAVALLNDQYLYTWNLQTARPKLQGECSVPRAASSSQVFSADTNTLVIPTRNHFEFIDTHTGTLQKTIPYKGVYSWAAARPCKSRYMLFFGAVNSWTDRVRVVRVSTGKVLWTFFVPVGVDGKWAMSDDERTIFIRDTNTWQVRELATGKLLRRLPMLPQTLVAVSSPDGSTLYSVAGGVLYKQRAR